jgi:nucleoid DNA-binding protein
VTVKHSGPSRALAKSLHGWNVLAILTWISFGESMTKAELIQQLAEATDRTKQETEQTLDLVFAGIATALQNGEKLELRGFGTFKIRDQKARVGRNPQTGEAVNIPAKKVPVFKPSKQLAEQVKG